MNAITRALDKKMGETDAKGFQKVKDYFSGTRRVDNAKNPASAHRMLLRKIENTLPRDKQK